MALLVAKEFFQVHWINYHKIFAPTVYMNNLHMLIAIAVAKGLKCQPVDVDDAFTESGFFKHIYISLSDGIRIKQNQVL